MPISVSPRRVLDGVLFSLLLSCGLPYALLISVRCRVERLISCMVSSYWLLVVCDLILMLTSRHFSRNKVVTVDCPLITWTWSSKMILFMTFRKWRLWVAWWLLIVLWSTSTVCVLNILLICNPAGHSLLLIPMLLPVSIVSRRTPFSLGLVDWSRELRFFVITCWNTVIHFFMPFLLSISLVMTLGMCIASWSVSHIFAFWIILRFFVSLTTVF